MELQRPGPTSSQKYLKSQHGFAYVFLISLLPLLLSAGFFLLFSQFLQKNWMQSLHICRTELLSAQKKTSRHLDNLMKLNPMAESLRLAKHMAQVELAMATAAMNAPAAARATARIMKIERQQRSLDKTQKSFLGLANQEMSKGLGKVTRTLNQQNRENQSRLPDFFKYRIHSIRSVPKLLAVKPDRPGIAPVYELKPRFKEEQALNVSWISEFQSNSAERSPWILNKHKRKDNCSATLVLERKKYSPALNEDRSFLKL